MYYNVRTMRQDERLELRIEAETLAAARREADRVGIPLSMWVRLLIRRTIARALARRRDAGEKEK